MFINNMTRKKSIFRGRKRNDLIFYCILLAFPIAQFCVFYIGVNFNSILLAFKTWDTDTATFVFNGFDTFKLAFRNLATVANYRVALRNSFVLYLLAWVTTTPLTQIVSFFIHKKAPFGQIIQVILFIPSIVSVMVLVTMYQYFVEEAIPSIATLITGKSYTGLLSNPNTRLLTLFMYGVWNGFGSGMLLYVNAMNSISPAIREAAKLDGVNFVQEYFHVTFPMIFGTFKTMVIIGAHGIIMGGLNLYEFYGLYAPSNVTNMSYILLQETLLSERSYPMVAALGIILTCVAAPLTFIVRKFLNKVDPLND